MSTENTQQEREPNWDGVLRREIAVSTRIIDEAERSVEVVASTEALDAHGDVIKQFWDLERYNKNGPVLWNHNVFESSRFSFGGAVRPDDLMPVGKGTNVRVEGNKLTATLVLVKGNAAEEPIVDKLWRRIQQGVIKAVSVGFRPGQVTAVTDSSGKITHYELGSTSRPNELREISFVPMGSNPEAVAKSLAWERRHLEAEISTRTIGQGPAPASRAVPAVRVADPSADIARAASERAAVPYEVPMRFESSSPATQRSAPAADASKELADLAARRIGGDDGIQSSIDALFPDPPNNAA